MGTKMSAKVDNKVNMSSVEKLLAQKEDGEILRIPVVLSIVETEKNIDWGKVQLLKEWTVKLHFGDGHGEVDEVTGFKLKRFDSRRKPGTKFDKLEVPYTTYIPKGKTEKSTITFVRNTTEDTDQDGRRVRLLSNIVRLIKATFPEVVEPCDPTGTAEDDSLVS